MLGMLLTNTWEPTGRPVASAFIVAENWARKSLTVVMVDGESVQTSFPPIKIVNIARSLCDCRLRLRCTAAHFGSGSSVVVVPSLNTRRQRQDAFVVTGDPVPCA